MSFRKTFIGRARRVVKIARILFVRFPKKHVRRLKAGSPKSSAHRSSGPIETPSRAINDRAIHEITCKFNPTLPPCSRICPMERAHIHLPALHGRVENPSLRAVVRSVFRKAFARFVKPARGQTGVGGASSSSAIGRANPVPVVAQVHDMREQKLLVVI